MSSESWVGKCIPIVGRCAGGVVVGTKKCNVDVCCMALASYVYAHGDCCQYTRVCATVPSEYISIDVHLEAHVSGLGLGLIARHICCIV